MINRMSKRQLPLFPSQPATPDDISKATPIGATMALFSEYLRQEGKSEHTIKAFIGDMNLLMEYTEAITPLGEFDTERLNKYLHWMEFDRGVSCSRKTYARRVTTLKVYFKWLANHKAIPNDPAVPILQRSGPAPLSPVLSRNEIRSAIDVSQGIKKGDDTDYRPEFILRLLLATGIKKAETARLKLSDIDRKNPDRPFVSIKHTVRNVFKERKIEFDSELLKLLDLYVAQYRPKDALFTCTTRNLEYILTDLGEEAEIPVKLSFEMLRWTFAVEQYRNGIEEEFIRDMMGLSQTSWYETSKKIKALALQVSDEEA